MCIEAWQGGTSRVPPAGLKAMLPSGTLNTDPRPPTRHDTKNDSSVEYGSPHAADWLRATVGQPEALPNTTDGISIVPRQQQQQDTSQHGMSNVALFTKQTQEKLP